MSIRLTGPIQLVTAKTSVASSRSQLTIAGRFQLDGCDEVNKPVNSGRIWRCQYDAAFGLQFEAKDPPANTKLFLTGSSGHQVQALTKIAPGVPISFCASWNDAQQFLWINGHLAASGSMAGATQSQSGQIELGATGQSPSTVLTLAGLVILDTFVTEDDALANRDDPTYLKTTYADDVRWCPDLTGPDGAPVALGDPGLVDLGSIRKDLIAMNGSGSATWSSASLAYVSPLKVTAKVTKKGKNIAFFFWNAGDGSRAYPTTVADHPELSIEDRDLFLPLDTPIFSNPDTKDSLPFVLYGLPEPFEILPGETVTYSAEDSWAVTSAGGAPAVDNAPVENGVGQPNFDLPEESEVKMAVGLNTHTHGEWYTNETERDLVKQSAAWTGVTRCDENGKPTGLSASRGYLTFENKSCENGLDKLRDVGVATIPGAPKNPCQYLVVLDEASAENDSDPLIRTNSCKGSEPQPTSQNALITDRTDLWHQEGTRKTRVFEVSRPANPASYALGLTLSVARADFTKVSVYGPGNDADESDPINENWKRQMRGAKVVRYMDYLRTNNSNFANPEDLPRLDLFNYRRSVSRFAPVQKMEPVDRPEDFLGLGAPWQTAKVTTAAPHGFTSGQYVTFEDCVNQSNGGAASVLAANGSAAPLNGRGAAIWVLNATQFEAVLYNGAGTGPNPTQTKAGIQNFDQSCSEVGFKLVNNPFERPFQHSSSIGADCWFCFPFPSTDELISTIALLARDYLTPGLKLWSEWSNEFWNLGNPFLGQSQGAIIAANKLGITGSYPAMQYGALRAAQAHQILADVFAEAGREEDLVRVISWRDGYTGGSLESFLDWCLAQGIGCDALCIAPYRQVPAGWASALDPYDLDQMHDFLQLFITHTYPRNSSDPTATIPTQKAILKSRYPNAKLVCYEGAQEKLTSSEMTDYIARTRDLWYDPEMYHTYTAWLAMLQNAGIDTYLHYSCTMDGAWYPGNPPYCTTWGLYKWPGQFAGKGDGSDGKFDNRTCRALSKPSNIHMDERCVSPAAQAFIDWSELTDA